MENLQKKHVNLSRTLLKESLCSGDRQLIKALLLDSESLKYFKKRLAAYSSTKNDKDITVSLNKILDSQSASEITRLLTNPVNYSKIFLGVLIHSYIHYKEGILSAVIDKQQYLKSKRLIFDSLKKRINTSSNILLS